MGKKQTCPYCKEKVDLKRMFSNPYPLCVCVPQFLTLIMRSVYKHAEYFITFTCIHLADALNQEDRADQKEVEKSLTGERKKEGTSQTLRLGL